MSNQSSQPDSRLSNPTVCPISSHEPPFPANTPKTTDSSAPAELSAVVDELLNSLSNKFAGVSSEIFAKSMSCPPGAHAS
jgi:hypothetical protein